MGRMMRPMKVLLMWREETTSSRVLTRFSARRVVFVVGFHEEVGVGF
jgi:hypothetical protein